ncbi:MAG: beta-galactosidase trimerization domain-containing protein, partial [Eubacterium sp.]|nr:beta-galactosidase trimerization domain-containing protein [Eubacterium sp.]
DLIRQGRRIVFGCRSGYKDPQGKCYDMPMPGYVTDLTGCQVEEYTYVSNFDRPVVIEAGRSRGDALIFHDILELTDGQVYGSFEGDCHYRGKPAIVGKKIGQGQGFYVGAGFSESLVNLLIDLLDLGAYNLTRDWMEVPASLEVMVRGSEDQVVFVLNYKEKESKIFLKKSMTNLLTGEKVEGQVRIPKYDFLLLK